MSSSTHAAFGSCAYLFVVVLAGEEPVPALLALSAASAVAADLDTSSSLPGRLIPPLSRLLEHVVGHRTLTHALLGAAIVGVALAPLLAWSGGAYAAIIAGYLSHPILDSMSVEGVELFYPFARVRCVFPYDAAAPYRYRITTGSRGDRALGAGFLVMLVPLYLLADSGYERMVRLAQQNILSAVRDYELLSPHRRVCARLRGINQVTHEVIDGTFGVVGSRDQHTLIIRDSGGRLRAVGDGDQLDFRALEVSCAAGESLRTEVAHMDLSGEPLLKAAMEVDSAAEVLLFGDLVLEDEPDLTASEGEFSPVRNTARRLVLDYASPGDLTAAGLRDVFVRSGKVTVVRRISGAPACAGGGARVCGMMLSTEDSIEVLVREMDTLEPGDTLARGHRRNSAANTDALTAGRLRNVSQQLAQQRRAALRDSADLSRARELEKRGFLAGHVVEQKREGLRRTLASLGELERAESLLVQQNAGAGGLSVPWQAALRSPVRGILQTLLCTRRGGRPRVIAVVRME